MRIGTTPGALVFTVVTACASHASPFPNGAASAVDKALIAGEYARALDMTASALRTEPRNAWLHYDRAVALAYFRRMPESIAEFRKAEGMFDDRRGKSLAIWGRARAYESAGHCHEADLEYSDYAAFVREWDPNGATLAHRYTRECTVPGAPVAATPNGHSIGGGPVRR